MTLGTRYRDEWGGVWIVVEVKDGQIRLNREPPCASVVRFAETIDKHFRKIEET